MAAREGNDACEEIGIAKHIGKRGMQLHVQSVLLLVI